MACLRSLPAPTTAMSFCLQYLMLSRRPLSPMSPAWLLAIVTTLIPLLAIAGARSGLPLMTTSFQPWGSPPVVSGLSRLTKPKSLFSKVGAMLLKRLLPMLATTPLTPKPLIVSPPAVTEKLGAELGVGLGDDVGDGSAADAEAAGAGVAATVAAGAPPAAVLSPLPKGPQPAAAATPAAAAKMRASTMRRKSRPPPLRLPRPPLPRLPPGGLSPPCGGAGPPAGGASPARYTVYGLSCLGGVLIGIP